MPKLKKETRYFGDGLPQVGVVDPLEAYQLALRWDRMQAVSAWRDSDARGSSSLNEAIAEHWDSLVRTISKATDDFIAENGTAVDLIEGNGPVDDYRHVEREAGRDMESGE